MLSLLFLLAAALPVSVEELDPPPEEQIVTEVIVVTPSATERPLSDEPASVTVLEREDLMADPALALDDVLQSVPGFSLFRRQSSIAAHPTTQGVSLRGTGASGAGRARVLRDGIPLNDPFGGWVLWGRVSKLSLDRIEVVRGGGAEIYGTSAVGGVIQLFPRRSSENALSLDLSAGELGTTNGAAYGSIQWDRWSAALSVEGFATDGWHVRRESDRGAVDRRAGSDRWLTDLTVGRDLPGGRAFFNLSRYEESRRNGTALQTNESEITMASGGIDWTSPSLAVSGRGWLSDQEMLSAFTAVSDDRSEERLVRDQRVPADSIGFNLRATAPVGSRHLLVGGTELLRVDAMSHETVILPDRSIPTRAGGEQRFAALWIEDIIRVLPELEITAGLRYDRWENREQSEQPVERDDSEPSPRLSILYRTSDSVAFTASVYRSFRAPTLNELYRGFRVGDVVTEANPALRAETMNGIETGLNAGRPSDIWSARIRLFWMELDDPIANVTVSASENLIVRQRRNLGETRSRGVEGDILVELPGEVRLRAGWLWTDSQIVAYPADPALEGNRLPQVPGHQGTLELRWAGQSSAATLQTHYVGSQFEDDENRFLLPSYVTLDLQLSRRFTRDLSVFVAGENLTDQRWTVGRTPLETIGPPRIVRGGVRWTVGFR